MDIVSFNRILSPQISGNLNMKKQFLFPATVMLALLMQAQASAQGYPSRPIQLIQPFAPGGAVELYARTITAKVTESIGQPFVIESRPGAGGNIAANYVAKAAPDGYTILQNQSGQAISPAIYRNLPFDAYNDFIPVTLVTTSPIFLVANGKSQFKTLGDFVAAAKAKPGSLSYGSAGVGTSLQFAMELLKSKAGIDVVHVPYRGVAPNTTAMIAGDVAVSIMPYAAVQPHIESGGLRILGVTAAKRTSLVPDVPTIAESGFPDYELVSWQGWFVPAKTPREIVNLLQREAAKALASKDVQDRLRLQGGEGVGSTQEHFEAYYRSELALYKRVAQEAKITAQD